ncbi:hypothetical protein [Hydrogenimonas sp. SS33]|uniref:hypothetical protein n=1 Tax=Hydrogenimonas leucolamina TaxID=2954236 RepID=UPI00336C05B7
MKLLTDPDFRTAPLATAMAYSQAAITANWKNTLIVALVLVVLSLLEFIPIVAIVFSLLQTIILYALGYWFVDRAKRSDTLSAFRESVKNDTPTGMMWEFAAPATGFYVGFFIFSLIMILITIGLFWLSGGFAMMATIQPPAANASPEQVYAFYGQILGTSTPAVLFVLITSLFFSYLWPLVYGYALFQRSFGDAFNAVFMFFSTRFWRAAFTWKYLKLATLWMLAVFAVGILMGITFATIFLIPLGILLLMWLIYFTAGASAAAYNQTDAV